MSFSRPRPGGAARALATTSLGLVLAAPLVPAAAATLTDTLLSAVPPDSSRASFVAPEAPGWQVTVLESGGTATMTGSDLFGYEGLWLGSPGQGGGYSVRFSQPVSSVSFAFIALTAFADAGAESLGSFVGDVPVVARFSSVDGSAAWNGAVLTALDEDSRAVLTFTATTSAGLRSIGFLHVQPEPLQGFVIEQLDFSPAAVPEPPALLLFGVGLVGLGLWRQRRLLPRLSAAVA